MKQLILTVLLIPALMSCGTGSTPAPEEQEATETTGAPEPAAKVDVPEVVSAAFAKQFPTCTDVEWEMEDAGTYEASFKENGDPHSASYHADGEWVETETPMAQAGLPAPVKEAISAAYPEHAIKEAEQLQRPAGMFYEVELERGGQVQEMVFAADGTVIEMNEEEEEGEEE